MKNILSASVGLIALSAVPAVAADLPVKARPMVPVVTAYNWSGCYIGANGGWIGQRSTFTTAPSGSYLNAAGALAPPNAAGTGLLTGDFTSAVHSYDVHDSGGGTIGGQIGCNYQFSGFLLGAEADLNWSSVKSGVNAAFAAFPSANPAFTISPETEVLSNRLDWFSTIRGRGGFTWDRWLVYATGGLAIGHFRSDTSVTYGTSGTSPVFAGSTHLGSNTTTRLGYAVGGGLEYAFTNNWSIKAEYLYMDFGSWGYRSALTTPVGAATAGYSWATTVSAREHVARVGINYKFY